MKNKKLSINIIIIITFTLLAIGGGFLGEIFTRVYIFNDIYSGTFGNELNLNDYNRSNLVIRDAKKVIVNQDVQVKESADQARESMVRLFVKNDKNSNLANSFYHLDDSLSTGLILSSDGWVIINFENFKSHSNQSFLIENYVVIDDDRKIYEIDEKVTIADSPLLFIHLEEANNLKPVSISSQKYLNSGQSVLALNGREQILTNYLGVEGELQMIKNSDNYSSNLRIYPQVQEFMLNPWLFNLKGEVISIWENDAWKALSEYRFAWENVLLEDSAEKISEPSLGVNYVDLTKVVNINISQKQGALIHPNKKGVSIINNSPADLAGLKEGDVIVSVNGMDLDDNLNLSEALLNFKAGEDIELTIARDNVLQIIKVKL